MNLKSYLRGLGIGIVVTAVIMGISLGGKKEGMSDAEIKVRARELGMTENTVLTQYAGEQDGQEPDSAGTGKPVEAEAPAVSENTGETGDAEETGPADTGDAEDITEPADTGYTDDAEDIAAPAVTGDTAGMAAENEETGETLSSGLPEKGAASPDMEAKAESGDSVVFTVEKGDGSGTVSRKLQEAGLITSAVDFDAFLCGNGYDKKITAGTHNIPTDASEEVIARILTGKER